MGAPVSILNQQFSDANGTPYAGGIAIHLRAWHDDARSHMERPRADGAQHQPCCARRRRALHHVGCGRLSARAERRRGQFDLECAIHGIRLCRHAAGYDGPDALPTRSTRWALNTAISTAVAAEASTRATADTSLTTAINTTDAALQTETDSRIQHDDLEIAARTNADTNLQAQINTLTGRHSDAVFPGRVVGARRQRRG